ncbi:hypothetical protein V6N12_032652 [Hibiscus sabdariffa]
MVSGLNQARHVDVANTSKRISISRNGCSWVNPQVGWVKANVNGVVSLHNDEVACEGVIGDANEELCVGFSRSLGQCPVLAAKM